MFPKVQLTQNQHNISLNKGLDLNLSSRAINSNPRHQCASVRRVALAALSCFVANQALNPKAQSHGALAFAPFRMPKFHPSVRSTFNIEPVQHPPTPIFSQKISVQDTQESHPIISFEQFNASSETPKHTQGGKPHSPIIQVETLEEFKQAVADEKEKIVAVKFFSPQCRACKAIQPQFSKMAKTLGANQSNIKFVEVKITDKNIFWICGRGNAGLSVPSTPFGHIYHPEAGLVEEASINRKKIQSFENTLNDYIRGYCELETKP